MLHAHKDKRINGFSDEQQDEVTEVHDGFTDADPASDKGADFED